MKEWVETRIDSTLLEAVRKLAAEQGREDSEVLEDAVSYYLLYIAEIPSGSGTVVSEKRRALARERLLELAGSGGLDDDEAQALAERAVRRARAEASVREEGMTALSPEEVRSRLGARRLEDSGAS